MDDEHAVRAALEAAGFSADDEDVAALVAAYPMVRGMVALVGELADRYEDEPALAFHADPRRK